MNRYLKQRAGTGILYLLVVLLMAFMYGHEWTSFLAKRVQKIRHRCDDGE